MTPLTSRADGAATAARIRRVHGSRQHGRDVDLARRRRGRHRLRRRQGGGRGDCSCAAASAAAQLCDALGSPRLLDCCAHFIEPPQPVAAGALRRASRVLGVGFVAVRRTKEAADAANVARRAKHAVRCRAVKVKGARARVYGAAHRGAREPAGVAADLQCAAQFVAQLSLPLGVQQPAASDADTTGEASAGDVYANRLLLVLQRPVEGGEAARAGRRMRSARALAQRGGNWLETEEGAGEQVNTHIKAPNPAAASSRSPRPQRAQQEPMGKGVARALTKRGRGFARGGAKRKRETQEARPTERTKR